MRIAIACVVVVVGCAAPETVRPVRPVGPAVELADAAAWLEGGILGRTVAGRVALFDADLQFLGETGENVTAITVYDGRAFAATVGGTIAELDARLQITPIARARGTPSWISVLGDELVVYVEKPRSIEVHRMDTHEVRIIPIENAPGPSMEVGRVSTWTRYGGFVWFGVDAGEWAGVLGRVDLANAMVRYVEQHHAPVAGIVVANGRTYVHGGKNHLGHTDGYVEEIVQMVAHPLATRRLPVVAMIPEGRDEFFALEWNEVFRVDATFARWMSLAHLAARASDGRPDATGGYPATTAVMSIGDRLIFATMRDGLFAMPVDHSQHASGRAVPVGPL